MRATVLNGLVKESEQESLVVSVLRQELDRAGYQAKERVLSDSHLLDCKGCFGCWVATPGQCCVGDEAAHLAGEAIDSDLLVLLTPIRFGSFSVPLKRVMDRIICIVMPFFHKQGAVSHHVPRYERSPALLGVGLSHPGWPAWDATFAALVGRLAVDFHSPSQGVVAVGERRTADVLSEQIRAAVWCAKGGAS